MNTWQPRLVEHNCLHSIPVGHITPKSDATPPVWHSETMFTLIYTKKEILARICSMVTCSYWLKHNRETPDCLGTVCTAVVHSVCLFRAYEISCLWGFVHCIFLCHIPLYACSFNLCWEPWILSFFFFFFCYIFFFFFFVCKLSLLHCRVQGSVHLLEVRVLLTSDLTWSKHIESICAKAKKLLGIIYK